MERVNSGKERVHLSMEIVNLRRERGGEGEEEGERGGGGGGGGIKGRRKESFKVGRRECKRESG